MIREYEKERDLEAVKRIWRETGWVSNDAEAAHVEGFFESAARAFVAELGGEAECAVHSTEGTMRYQSEDLRLRAVTAVTTSRVARKQGFAGALTARLLAADALDGGEISALGMFEQGFYDRLGFGTGTYEHWIKFDPATLTVDRPFRVPRRFGVDDWEALHGAMCRRRRTHGECNLEPAGMLRSELGWCESPFGLGYCDGPDGSVSHFFFGSAKGENGPYTINFCAWQTAEQLQELLSLLRSLGDQISSIEMREIAQIQFQDLLRHPFRVNRMTERGRFESSRATFAIWQARILDLTACLAKTRLPTPAVRFNLRLDDPVEAFLPEDSAWRGIGGDYTVTLGPESRVVPGHEPGLDRLEASVGAFTRLWLGIQPASSLAITDRLEAPASLLDRLDDSVRLPRAHPAWDF